MSTTGTPQKGSDTQIVVGNQSSQRSTVTPTRHLGYIEEETEHPDPEISWLNEYLIGTGREMHGKSEGQRTYEGGSYPIINYDGYPIALLFGEESVTAVDSDSDGTTDYHEHTLTVAEGKTPPAITVEATHYGRGGASDFVRTFNTVVPTSGEISVDNEGRLTTTLDTVALGVSTGTSPTSVSLPDRNPWLFSDISSDFTFDGTSFARFEEFTYSLNQNSSARHYINSTTGADPYEILYGGQANHELTATITVTDSTLYDELLNATSGGVSASMRFTRANGDYVDFDFSATNLSEVPHSTPRGEGADDDTVSVEATIVPESVTVTVRDSYSGGAYL